MRNLVPVVSDDIARLEALVSRKTLARRSRLSAHLPTILGRYNDYRTHNGELSEIAARPWAEQVFIDLISLYTHETVELAALKKSIVDNQPAVARSFCQYCAIGEPTTFDHYAPTSKFPEFSIFSLNLIPCCGQCNLYKRDAWADKGHRCFINFYYDTFIQYVLLHAELQIELNGEMAVVFSLRGDSHVTPVQLSIICSHYEGLDLFQRYAERATGLISEVRCILPTLPMRLGEIVDYLREEANTKADLYGLNYWQAAIYRCLSSSYRFLEECLGDGWLPRARSEVVHLLALPVSPDSTERLRALVIIRAWRLRVSRGLRDDLQTDYWLIARAELGLPDSRRV